MNNIKILKCKQSDGSAIVYKECIIRAKYSREVPNLL